MPELLRSAGWSPHAHYPVVRWLIAGGIATAVAMVARRITRFEVVGDSMRPTLEAGERVVIVRSGRVRRGDLVVVADPRRPERLLVKRVVSMSAAGVTLRGDNPVASTDSRHYGAVQRAGIVGRVLYRYHPPPRRGRIRRWYPELDAGG